MTKEYKVGDTVYAKGTVAPIAPTVSKKDEDKK